MPNHSSHLLEDDRADHDRTFATCPPTVLLRIEFTASDSLQPMGELLPRLSTLTACLAQGARHAVIARGPSTGPLARSRVVWPQAALPDYAGTPLSTPQSAVYFCCTFPEVAFGGRYPLSLPYGARTFLMTGLSPPPRDRLSYSSPFYRRRGDLSTPKPAGLDKFVVFFAVRWYNSRKAAIIFYLSPFSRPCRGNRKRWHIVPQNLAILWYNITTGNI